MQVIFINIIKHYKIYEEIGFYGDDVFFGITANAQAWTGKGDQKIQLGLSAWGYGTGITGTYDYGLNKLISVGLDLTVTSAITRTTTRITVFLFLED